MNGPKKITTERISYRALSKPLKAILLMSAIIFVAIGIVNYSISCDQIVVKVTPNNANDKILVQYDLECAALAGSSNLVVLDSQYQIYVLSFFEPVFTSEYDYSKELHANWVGAKNIEVNVPHDFKIFRRKEELGDVKIRYIME
jgi:hypothetical protein